MGVIVSTAEASYIKDPESDLDLSVFQIDERRYLGVGIPKKLPLITETGETITLGDMIGQPLIMVLSYYTCDGACSVINQDLVNRLSETKRVKIGKDFKVLTLSFDRHDTLDTMAVFRAKLDSIPLPKAGWIFAAFMEDEHIRQLTDKLGFKFFWSPRDRIFYHPGAFLFFSPSGRLARVLYTQNIDASDVELAILESKGSTFAPREIANFAVSMCFSYNYVDGKYTLNYPIIIAGGALFFGLSLFFVSALVFRRRKRKERFQ